MFLSIHRASCSSQLCVSLVRTPFQLTSNSASAYSHYLVLPLLRACSMLQLSLRCSLPHLRIPVPALRQAACVLHLPSLPFSPCSPSDLDSVLNKAGRKRCRDAVAYLAASKPRQNKELKWALHGAVSLYFGNGGGRGRAVKCAPSVGVIKCFQAFALHAFT
jgi:hypothetical protein